MDGKSTELIETCRFQENPSISSCSALTAKPALQVRCTTRTWWVQMYLTCRSWLNSYSLLINTRGSFGGLFLTIWKTTQGVFWFRWHANNSSKWWRLENITSLASRKLVHSRWKQFRWRHIDRPSSNCRQQQHVPALFCPTKYRLPRHGVYHVAAWRAGAARNNRHCCCCWRCWIKASFQQLMRSVVQ